ncbi:vacuolar iron transporter homolog 4-like [Miscanthus floridulus]|uniref:vacuolar iron transporter homolog 4-like n=1 Tax=Miscanthus floridulus TaxID=154761 RepID=UPI0034592978
MATAVSNDDASKLTVVVLGPGAVGAAAAAASAVSAATKPPPPAAQHVQWLRAAVLGASDGLVSTAALMLGVGAARPADADADADDLRGGRAVLLAGLAGLVGGACSMAIGEYVSVHAQLDVELAELKRAAEEEVEAAAVGDGAPVDQTAGLSSPGQAAAASAVSFAAGAAVLVRHGIQFTGGGGDFF